MSRSKPKKCEAADYNGPYHLEGIYHDCDYVDFRNSLIPVAEAEANRLVGEEPDGRDVEAWEAAWNTAFHRAMNLYARDPFPSTRPDVVTVH